MKECNIKPIMKFEGKTLERQVKTLSRWLGQDFKKKALDNGILYRVQSYEPVCKSCEYKKLYGIDTYCFNKNLEEI